jgi:predicted ATPase
MDRGAVRGRQPSAAPTNLPHHLTSFVGREADLRSLKALLSTARLVTLTGTGGAGKSRLAAEVAKANPTLWPDGAWWIELAAADDVPGAVVATLELPGRGPAQDVVSSWLAARKALLVLDNCEHLVAECAALSQRLLERCPHLNIIATSREPLGVPGEARWPVAPLRDPDMLQLFESRARLVAPNFKVAALNLEDVTRICERLDRLPLAIEMGAARIDVMSEQELLSNLNDGFRFLTSGSRTAPQRQQTMAAAIDWSYRLLTDDEVRLFRRLAVFQEGFTREGAQAVCADETDSNLMGLLGGLVQKSMVVADRLDDGSTRFRLLESHHAYALERLREAGELELMNKRHYEYFIAFSSRTSSRTGPKYEGAAPGIAEQKWKARESANLWAALTWARDHTDDMGLSLALEVTASEFSDHARGTAVLLDLLAHSGDRPARELRAKALILAALRVSRQSDPKTSQSLADTSVTLARQLPDPELLAYILNGAGMVYSAGGDLDTAVRTCNEAASLLKGSSNLRLTMGVKNAQESQHHHQRSRDHVSRRRHGRCRLRAETAGYASRHPVVAAADNPGRGHVCFLDGGRAGRHRANACAQTRPVSCGDFWFDRHRRERAQVGGLDVRTEGGEVQLSRRAQSGGGHHALLLLGDDRVPPLPRGGGMVGCSKPSGSPAARR